ncbi:hypothetical protein ACJ73_04910 [Blastomyces percursus]|uniref:Uncharacterized protein n=1 Tax=Blastomyces percursus TaxID=1658174 RepID=A0A1J9Q4X8_9EURO|nr:hypothetical protein ACJ73_04910 [Blastomyces percursus]
MHGRYAWHAKLPSLDIRVTITSSPCKYLGTFLRLPLNEQDMTLAQLHARTGEPAKELVVCEDDAPLAIVPVWLGLSNDEISLTDSAITIANFGEAF